MNIKIRVWEVCKKFWYRLFFTAEDHLDLTWFFVLLMGCAGVFGLVWEVVTNGQATNAAWAFMGASFASVLIAAVPIAKARLLAQTKATKELADAITSAPSVISETSAINVLPNVREDDETGS